MTDKCYLVQGGPPVFVLLGRYGDLCQLLPCFMEIHRRTQKKPVVICSEDYAPILEGVSYVQAHPFRCHWWKDIPKAKAIAQEQYGGGTVVQFWHEPPKHNDTIGYAGRHWTILQSHGKEHGVNTALDPDYGTSMARRCGFSQAEWMQLPLVFDRRNEEREERLVKMLSSRRKPMLLFNFHGVSSPFAHTAEAISMMRRFSTQFHLVNLGVVKAHRIYDMLGLMDRAVGMVTSDTATLHLAPASKLPSYVAYTVDGWCASRPKGQCVLEIKYRQARKRMEELKQWLERLKEPK